MDVALHLPDVGGMGFENVHGVKGDLPGVLFGELVEGRNLPPERGSSVTAEHKYYRLLGI